MGRVLMRTGGGLTAADRAKLVPSNIRQGVTLFEGTQHEVTGVLSGDNLVGFITGGCTTGGSNTRAVSVAKALTNDVSASGGGLGTKTSTATLNIVKTGKYTVHVASEGTLNGSSSTNAGTYNFSQGESVSITMKSSGDGSFSAGTIGLALVRHN